MGGLYLLDYGAGNVRSLVNAVNQLGYEMNWVNEPSDILKADKLIFPGVGAFGSAIEALNTKHYADPLREYIRSGKPFMGICVGLQSLFEGSEESPDVSGLGIIPGVVRRFDTMDKAVPHMGWNEVFLLKNSLQSKNEENLDKNDDVLHYGIKQRTAYYFVHSYAVPYNSQLKEWTLAITQYGTEKFVSVVQKDNIFCTQFHPEKSGYSGLRILRAFLETNGAAVQLTQKTINIIRSLDDVTNNKKDRFRKRVIACLDVRTNDEGDLVVTKGDQYDVRDRTTTANDNNHINNNNGLSNIVNVAGQVRNLGKPVDLAKRYFDEGADEITFLNITSFRNSPLTDLPMLEILRRTSETVFVPLTIGGGIRDIIDPDGKFHSALEVAGEYFRSGADKVSIGSDAVYATEKYLKNGKKCNGDTAIETIAHAYGSQAVVISVDPKRVYVKSPTDTNHHCLETSIPGPNGESYCWYQCTVKGGREAHDIDVYQLVNACEAMGAGEILLNCINRDGTSSGFDIELIRDVKKSVRIPVIASSGAGNEEHFVEVFRETGVEAALAAGIFHRREVPIESVKRVLKGRGVLIRDSDTVL
ncbi:9639_t:CDS:2 [Ambispora gerdemannii]|uniref:Imidazole glycerol phosphate synthase hisHF n=1 Tax=Ambispora gerdemannii TaxID=144530 RepID=A0A9N8W4S4_9GLOM|nr:9639_t:CDS:2 [Ambispora gerdemannii]